jgi:hypothetical protein
MRVADTGQDLFPHATKLVLLTFSKNYGTLEAIEAEVCTKRPKIKLSKPTRGRVGE